MTRQPRREAILTINTTGDDAKASNVAGNLHLLGPDGNCVAGAAQADASDVLNGLAAADYLLRPIGQAANESVRER